MRRLPWLIALILFVAACNPGTEGSEPPTGEVADPEKVSGTLEVWGFGTEDPIGKTRVEAFEEAYPNVKVELTPGTFDQQKFLSAVASGNPPDIIYMSRAMIGSFAARGALTPVDNYIESAELDTGVFYESTMDQVVFDDQVWGLPDFMNVIVVYADIDTLDQAGVALDEIDFGDWDALASVARELTSASGGDIQRVGFDPKAPEFLPLWAAANGGQLISDDGTEALLDSPEVIEAAEQMAELRDLVGQGAYAAFAQSWDIFGEKNPLAADQLAMTLFEQWYLGVLQEVSPKEEVRVVPFKMRDSDENITFGSGNAWAIPEGAKDADAAFAFMQTMTDADTWVEAAEANKEETEKGGGVYTGTYTGNRDADERIFSEVYEPSGSDALNEAVQLFRELQEQAVTTPANAVGAQLEQMYLDAVNAVLLGRKSAEEAMTEADEEVQQAIDEALE